MSDNTRNGTHYSNGALNKVGGVGGVLKGLLELPGTGGEIGSRGVGSGGSENGGC